LNGSLRIIAPGRVHLGFYNIQFQNILFGGLGLSLDKPFYDIIAKKSEKIEVICEDNETRNYLEKVLEKIFSKIEVYDKILLELRSYIPRHIGLGSTTQLLMSINKILAEIFNIKMSPWELFELVGRKNGSGIGVESFLRGGFIIDSGIYKRKNPKTIVRIPFPRSWKVILVIPKSDRKISEENEAELLIPREPLSTLQDRLLRITFLKILPAVVHKDYFEFVGGLEELERNIGEYYESIQGGIFSSEQGEDIARILKEAGFRGIGQSSWGPTIYGFVSSKRELIKGKQVVLQRLKKEGIDAQVIIANPRNNGVKILAKKKI